MTLSPGTRLGAYEVLTLVGRGGMGEVYRAFDSRLGRHVALKVLHTAIAAEPDQLRRFEQEARAAAALNHPNIVAVYELGTQNGSTFVVSELLDGETLRSALARGPLGTQKAIAYAIQIAQGLTAAHAAGIVHRDLKPENLFVTKDGLVKILDFGLAKVRPLSPDGSGSFAGTVAPETHEGTLLGTFGYMSPEQLRGQRVDERADMFALGAILYEMVSSRRAFPGETPADSMTAVLGSEPPILSDVDGATPPALARLVQRAMDRSVDQRFSSAHDFALALDALAAPDAARRPSPAPVGGGRMRRWERGAWTAAMVLVLVTASLVTRSLRPNQNTTRERPIRFQIAAPANTTFDFLDDNAGAPAISPDGTHLVFVADTAEGTSRLFLRSLDTLPVRDLPDTDGAQHPFWSFDGRSVGFYADGKLKSVDISGGPPHTVCDLRNLRGGLRGGTWNADGVILFSTGSFVGLYRVPASGGIPTAVTTLDPTRAENSHRWPTFLPDGRHFLYFVRTPQAETTGVYVGTLESSHGQFLVASESGPVYAAPGHLLFVRHGALLAQAFDARALRLAGEPFTIVEQVALSGVTRRGMFTASDTGVLAYWNGADLPRTLTWFARNGERLATLGNPRAFGNPAISPDGRRVAVEVFDAATGASDIWLINTATNVASRFTFERGHRRYPLWSPDGSRIVYQSDHDGSPAFYEKASSGAGVERVLLKPTGAATITPEDWTAGGGTSIVYQITDPLRDTDIWMLPFETHVPVPVVQGRFDQAYPRVSPDAQWMAYVSNESGRPEVYVQAFPGPGGTVQISTTGGTEPQWRRDGRELYYLGADRRIMAVLVEVAPGRFTAGGPTVLFAAPVGTLDIFARNHFAPSADGQRFLVNSLVTDATPAPITVVSNWLADVKR